MLQPCELNTGKFAHELRATTLECNAGQYEVNLILALFYKRYISNHPHHISYNKTKQQTR